MLKKFMYRRKKRWIIYSLSILTVILLILFTIFEIRVRPIINKVALSRANSLAVRVISEVVNSAMAKSDTKYSDLIVLEKNAQGNVTAVTLNIINVNKLKSNLAVEIEKSISDIDTMTTKIPLGNLLNQSLMSGIGPKITVKTIPVGYVSIDVDNSFSSAGINQTKHEIYLSVNCAISVLLPMGSDSTVVETKIPIAETIIVGSVPETYTNVEGQQSPEDAVLNLLPD